MENSNAKQIRIEPDWNVKVLHYRKTQKVFYTIRIEPDWNVKISNCNLFTILIAIRIEPDWNVKIFNASNCSMYLALE